MAYGDKPNQLRAECTLSFDRLAWFRKWRPELMPHGGWDRLKELEKERFKTRDFSEPTNKTNEDF